MSAQYTICPKCREQIKKGTTVCPVCKRDIGPNPPPPPRPNEDAKRPPKQMWE